MLVSPDCLEKIRPRPFEDEANALYLDGTVGASEVAQSWVEKNAVGATSILLLFRPSQGTCTEEAYSTVIRKCLVPKPARREETAFWRFDGQGAGENPVLDWAEYQRGNGVIGPVPNFVFQFNSQNGKVEPVRFPGSADPGDWRQYCLQNPLAQYGVLDE